MAVKRILRYLRGTTRFGLLYTKGAESEVLVGYADADWEGDCNDYKSTSGYVFQIGGTAVTWKSKKQSCVALSIAEAEYMALSSAAQEAVWVQELNSDLRDQQSQPILILEDTSPLYRWPKIQQIKTHQHQIPLHSRTGQQWQDSSRVLSNLRNVGRYVDKRNQT